MKGSVAVYFDKPAFRYFYKGNDEDQQKVYKAFSGHFKHKAWKLVGNSAEEVEEYVMKNIWPLEERPEMPFKMWSNERMLFIVKNP